MAPLRHHYSLTVRVRSDICPCITSLFRKGRFTEKAPFTVQHNHTTVWCLASSIGAVGGLRVLLIGSPVVVMREGQAQPLSSPRFYPAGLGMKPSHHCQSGEIIHDRMVPNADMSQFDCLFVLVFLSKMSSEPPPFYLNFFLTSIPTSTFLPSILSSSLLNIHETIKLNRWMRLYYCCPRTHTRTHTHIQTYRKYTFICNNIHFLFTLDGR